MKKYMALTTVFDKVNKHTAVEREHVHLSSIEVFSNKTEATIINSQNNKLIIPIAVFEKYFIEIK